MPQLDYLIIIPQIFWLFLLFWCFYFFLTYFFLPLFLYTIKLRKEFIKYNQIFELKLTTEILKEHQSMLKNLNTILTSIHSILFTQFIHVNFRFYKKPFKKTFLLVNKKLLASLIKSILFCNSVSLNSLKFYPVFLNKKIIK
uniref:ATP synthase F0 subunit 8 n=1 Tax=Periphykon beckeri TaxID=2006982 RepID=UPI0022FDA229|nr:ATP synthase F0 subunit 8 [Periphykon beckeri]WAX04151.1 ATP synthase F0 subunit 8 [Periphykon beckeri]